MQIRAGIIAAVVSVLACPAAASGAVVPDASCPPPAEAFFSDFSTTGDWRFAQTFTVQNSGSLVTAQVELQKPSGSSGDYVMQIAELDGSGVPTNTVLTSQTIPNSAVQSGISLVSANFADPLAVSAGQQLAVVITRPGGGAFSAGERFGDCPGNFYFSDSQTNPYALTDPDGDMIFAVFINADFDAPETTIINGPKDKTRKRTASFGLSSSEPASTFACSLDGGPFEACTSPKTYDHLKRKKHHFEVRATDAAGNTDPTPASFDWKVKKKKKK
jgi:hypothetical protein